MEFVSLDHATRRRGLWVLLADTFLMFCGFFMLVPLISVHYVTELGFAAAAVGLVLAARQLTQQGLTVFGGALADRIGAKRLIVWGMLLRSLSFAGLAWADTFGLLLLWCIIAALGGALFEAPRVAAVAEFAAPEQRTRFFALSGIVGGLGMTIGPLLGALLLQLDFAVVCWVASAMFAVAWVLTALVMPPTSLGGERSVLGGVGLAARDRRFVIFTLLLGGYWFMWVQLSITLPLAAQRWAAPVLLTPWGAVAFPGVSLVYMLNAVLAVLLQYPLLRLAERALRPLQIIVAGTAAMALGLGLVAAANSLPALLGCVVVFALGALLVQPVQQTVTADMAGDSAYGAYFGFGALALAFGGGSGNYLGGWLYDLAVLYDRPALPWLVMLALGLAVSIGLWMLDRAMRVEGRRSEVEGRKVERLKG